MVLIIAQKFSSRRVELDIVSWSNDQPAVLANRFQSLVALPCAHPWQTHRAGCAAHQLNPRSTVGHQILSSIASRVHAGGLDRVQNVRPNFDQIPDDGIDITVGMVCHFEIGLMVFNSAIKFAILGFKKRRHSVGRDQH